MTDLAEAAKRLSSGIAELAVDFDFVLIDAGSGLSAGAGLLAETADEAVVVTTPEPTSIADAHAAISRFHQAGVSQLRVLINQATSAVEGRSVLDTVVSASRQFSGAVVSPLGPAVMRADRRVQAAVRSRRPFITAYPSCAASRGVRRIAQAVFREQDPKIRAKRPNIRAALSGRFWA
jgi:flagellar biosynthesis protein FlhG